MSTQRTVRVRSTRGAACLLMASLMLAGPATAVDLDGPPKGSQAPLGDRIADVPLRTLGFFRLVLGSAMMIPTSMMTAIPAAIDRNMGPLEDNYELYVGEPFRYTFQRPWGEDLTGG